MSVGDGLVQHGEQLALPFATYAESPSVCGSSAVFMSSMRYCSRQVSSAQPAGMNGHISKPIEIHTLLKMLEGVLE